MDPAKRAQWFTGKRLGQVDCISGLLWRACCTLTFQLGNTLSKGIAQCEVILRGIVPAIVKVGEVFGDGDQSGAAVSAAAGSGHPC